MFFYVAALIAAQTLPQAELPGISGWVGTGLLGSVLAWLLVKHIPSLQDGNRVILTTMIDTHQQEMEQSRKDFRESLELVIQAFRRESEVHTASLARLDANIVRVLEREQRPPKIRREGE